jgi:aromatic ring-opening dioxygenase catalytic subunit (LigB family)
MSYHNLPLMFAPQGNADSAAFDEWLGTAVEDPAGREQALTRWAAAPGARASHPREEHLIPLMVAAGAGGADRGVRTYGEAIAGKRISGFQFG